MASQSLDTATASAMAATLGPFSSTSASLGLGATNSSSTASAAWAWSTAPKPGLRAWSAALPPTGITLSASALQTLRSSVRSTVKAKPELTATARSLTTSEVDLKKTMGAPLEMAQVGGGGAEGGGGGMKNIMINRNLLRTLINPNKRPPHP